MHAEGFRLRGRRRYCSEESERTNMFSGFNRHISIMFKEIKYLFLDSTRGDENVISSVRYVLSGASLLFLSPSHCLQVRPIGKEKYTVEESTKLTNKVCRMCW